MCRQAHQHNLQVDPGFTGDDIADDIKTKLKVREIEIPHPSCLVGSPAFDGFAEIKHFDIVNYLVQF